MKESGIFGGGFILSRRAAAERAEAEREARIREDEGKSFTWRLSDRERILQDTLQKKGQRKCES